MSAASFAVHAATLRGAEAVPVTVEVSASGGIPGLTVVGMPDSSVLEARSRVRAAIKACGFTMPRLHLTINLSPGDFRKTGTGFDLPMAVAILAFTGQIPSRGLDGCLFVGELGLDGSVLPVRGMVAYGVLAKAQGLCVVASSERGPSLGIERRKCLDTVGELLGGVESLGEASQGLGVLRKTIAPSGETSDFSDVIDQEAAKHAFEIAAVGRHGLLMVGPPGAGKTMLASRMPTILPALTQSEIEETLLLYSVAGERLEDIVAGRRPYRAPHHSVSRAGLIGGGRPVLPGEISLAHNGVLFLDELPEFAPSVLQSLRQPMEEGAVRLVRADGIYTFPCLFQMIAAANPCPCGHLGDLGHPCTCSVAAVQQYQQRIGGPLMDRIDLRVDVARPQSSKVIHGEEGLSSAQMREHVRSAREFRTWREARRSLGEDDPPLVAGFEAQALVAFEGTAERLALGGRAIARVARVARSVADLHEHELVERDDVLEALAFRTRDGL